MRIVVGVLLALALLASDARATFPGTSGLVAHGCPEGPGICVVGTDGSAPRRLTATGTSPAWSPDGTVLAYLDDGIVVVAADGSGVRRVTGPVGYDPAWNPQGTRLVYWASNGLRSVAADGSGDRKLFDVAGGGTPANPDWSPDGTRIAFATQGRTSECAFDHCTTFATAGVVAVAALDGTNVRVLATDAGAPSWSPDGRWIAYAAYDCAGRSPCVAGPDARIRRVSLETGEVVDLGRGGLDPQFSPDGTRIVYNDGPALTSVALDGSDPRALGRGSDADWQAVDGPPPPYEVSLGPEPTPALTVVERDAPWRLLGTTRGGRGLRILYETGGCLRRDGTAVAVETRRAIRITVRQTEVRGLPCATILLPTPLTVRLKRRVGGRAIRGGPRFAYEPAPVRVPRVVGLRRADARRALLGVPARLRVRGGVVTRQRPGAGTRVSPR